MTIATSLRWAVLTGASLLAVGLSSACQIIPNLTGSTEPGASTGGQTTAVLSVPADATAVPTRRPAAAGTVPVKRDSITETLSLDGLVVAQDQVPVTYPGRGTVVDVKVKAGQDIKQGDVLLELEGPRHQAAEDLSHQLDAARAKLQLAQTSLAKAQAKASQPAPIDPAAIDRQQLAVADATTGLRHAQDNLTKVQAGALPADRQAARAAVDTAQANVQTAQDLLDKLASGPDPDAIRTATRDVTTAQVSLARAQGALDILTRGPDPTAVREAQGQFSRAQTQLQIAQAAKLDLKVDPAIARIQHDQAIQDAQLAVDSAQASLARLKLPAPGTDVLAARQSVQDAQDAVTTAQAKLDALQAGPAQSALDAAQAVVVKANLGLAAAVKNYNDVTSHPTALELGDAQDQVRKAQAALDVAGRAPVAPPTDLAASDLDMQQAAIAQDQADIDALEQSLAATELLAPFDGTVVAVRVKAGDTVTGAKPVFVLAKPGSANVRVDLTDDVAGRLTVGQPATLQFDTPSTAPAAIAATVTKITPAAADGSTSGWATFAVSWANGQAPRLGAPVVVSLTLQQKDDVLVVPMSALHISGDHATVEVLNGTLRRIVTVQVGIRTPKTAEIVSGLSEGQMVLAAAAQ